jgi:hypothetical protein
MEVVVSAKRGGEEITTEERKKKEMLNRFHRTKTLRRSMKRTLTAHTLTRWFI